jgi:hypothetical protein
MRPEISQARTSLKSDEYWLIELCELRQLSQRCKVTASGHKVCSTMSTGLDLTNLPKQTNLNNRNVEATGGQGNA